MIDPLAAWNSAKTAFDEGRLQDALTQFMALRGENPRDAALFFNIGNLQFRLGSFGSAVAHLDRAVSLAPEHPEFLKTLGIARQAVLAQTSVDWDPSANWFERVDQTVPLSALGAGFALILAVSTIFSRKRPRTLARNVITGGCAALALLSAALARTSSRVPRAVAAESSVVRSGPGDSFLELARLDAGIEVRDFAAEASAEWARVRFGPGKIGWVKKSTLLPLE